MRDGILFYMVKVRTVDDFADDYHGDYEWYQPYFDWLWYWLSGDRSADKQAVNQSALNEENMAREYEYQKKSAVEMPTLQMQGLQDSGISLGAAAQALTGGSSVQSPSFSSAGSASQGIPPANMLNGFMDLIPAFMQQKLIDAQASNLNKDTEIKEKKFNLDEKLTNHIIKKDIEQLRQNAYKLGLDSRQLDLTERLITSQVDLNRSQVDKNFAELDKIASEVQRNMSQSAYIDAQTLHEFVKMDNTRLDSILKQAQTNESIARTGMAQQQTLESQSSTMLNTQLAYESEARTNKTIAETTGQNLTNEQLEMANFVKQNRLAISEALGFEIDAPEVTQVLESMVNGDFNACLKALSSIQNGYEGFARRTVSNLNVHGQAGQRGRSSYYFQDNKSDYRYHWYPRFRD